MAISWSSFRSFPDQVQLAVAAYNAGPGRVEQLLNEATRAGTPTTYAAIAPRLPAETQAYVGSVLSPEIMQAAGAGQAAAASRSTTKIAATWQKQIEDTLHNLASCKSKSKR